MSKRTPFIDTNSPQISSAQRVASPALNYVQAQLTKRCALISKETELEYRWAVSPEGKKSFRLGKSKAGGGNNSIRFDVAALLERLEELDRPFKTADMAKIIERVRCRNTAGYVIAVLVNEGFVEQLPSQELGKKSCPRWFRVVHPSHLSA